MPDKIQAILCDLDGVLTRTAQIHAQSWKLLFDEFLKEYGPLKHTSFPEFNIMHDYPAYIDGKPRIEGIKSYLRLRDIDLPDGSKEDPSGIHTIQGLAKRKNEFFNRLLIDQGVEVYQRSLDQLRLWKESGYKTGVVSSSKNCMNILRSVNILDLFDVVVDGLVAEKETLKGKPEPDTFLYAAQLLKIAPENTLVAEDAYAGVEAGKKGGFGLVIGIIHHNDGEQLYHSGAGLVVNDLSEVNLEKPVPFVPESPDDPFSDAWHIVRKGCHLDTERSIESILSISNGFIGTRNSLEESYSFSEPFTAVAGVYRNIPGTSSNELAKIPDWTRIQIILDDSVVDIFNSETLFHKRYLDLKRGLAVRVWKFKDNLGRVLSVKILKFISLYRENEAYKSIEIETENYSGKIKLISGIESSQNDGKTIHVDPAEFSIRVIPEGGAKNVKLFQYSYFPNFEGKYGKRTETNGIYEEWEWTSQMGEKYLIGGIVRIYSGRPEDKLPGEAGLQPAYFEQCWNLHIAAWRKFWNDSGVTVKGKGEEQQWINFSLYHLYSAGKFSGGDKSIGARALTGTVYLGHIFWDTEIFLLPFYIFSYPEIARELLMYRYNTLNGAKQKAKKEHQEGASFAWESSDSGLEVAPTQAIAPYGETIPIYTGTYEIHITPDIAFAVWYYWKATGDDSFLIHYGSEIIFEVARFCKGVLKKEPDGLYHTNRIEGPDEYHDMVDDNAYTNIMIQYSLEIAVRLFDFMQLNYAENLKKLEEKIGINDAEIASWDRVRKDIYTGFDPESTVYEQFRGFFSLEFLDLKAYEPRNGPIDLLLGRERTNKTQVLKQPDVLMFLFLMPERTEPVRSEKENGFHHTAALSSSVEGSEKKATLEIPLEKTISSEDLLAANYNFYEPRTAHGSSLSPSIHAVLAARLGNVDQAYRYFVQNAQIDLDEHSGNAAGGVHIGAMGGGWMALIMGFAGMYMTDKGIVLNPHLPQQLEEISFSVYFRKQKIKIHITKKEILICIRGNQALEVRTGQGNWKSLTPGKNHKITLTTAMER